MANVLEMQPRQPNPEDPPCKKCDGYGRLITSQPDTSRVMPKTCEECGGVIHPTKTRIPDEIIFGPSQYASQDSKLTEQQRRNTQHNK